MKIRSFGIELRKKTPKSEQWFQSRCKQLCFVFWRKPVFSGQWVDQFNVPLYGQVIPDVTNKACGYVVEVDGSFHDLTSQKIKDSNKDLKYSRWKLEVIRIRAYDEDSLMAGLHKIESLRRACCLPAGNIRGKFPGYGFKDPWK